MTATRENFEAIAQGLGVVVHTEGEGPSQRVVVSRVAADWSLPPVVVAMGEVGVWDRATAALREIAPQIQRAVARANDDSEKVLIAAGVGSDGSVTTIRIERDGSVRLHPDDIALIAAAVVDELGKRAAT